MIYTERSSEHEEPLEGCVVRGDGPDETLRTERLQVERKTYIFMLKQNDRGRFLRIVEGAGKTRRSIIVPDTGLGDFRRVLAEMEETAHVGRPDTDES